MPASRSYLPNSDRVGILIASVLLTYAFTRIAQTPGLTLNLSLPGFYFTLPLTLSAVLSTLAAVLAFTGMDALTRSHPALGEKTNLEHLALPTLTTLVLGASLDLLPNGLTWWAGFLFVAFVLVCVYLAEYITIDPSAPGYAFARAGLTALAYALFLTMGMALKASGIRMFLLVPILFFTATIISLRILRLDGIDRWDLPWALGIGLVCAQIGAGLHYWPLTPIQFSLAITGPLYALTMFSTKTTVENIPLRRATLGPLITLGAAWVLAVFLK
ncbi:MAG: hypothetical protein IT310_04645 [Anaerolineales bacterium]|nr:hypothetical protein [Anaerolineales bacterium]